jgi:lactate permease
LIYHQLVCIATAATNQVGNEGSTFPFPFLHSVALAAIVGVIVMIYAYVLPQYIPNGLSFVH